MWLEAVQQGLRGGLPSRAWSLGVYPQSHLYQAWWCLPVISATGRQGRLKVQGQPGMHLRPSSRMTLRAGDIAQLEECLPSLHTQTHGLSALYNGYDGAGLWSQYSTQKGRQEAQQLKATLQVSLDKWDARPFHMTLVHCQDVIHTVLPRVLPIRKGFGILMSRLDCVFEAQY